MTWETTACFGFVVVCSTVIYCFQLYIASTTTPPSQVTKEEFEELRNATSVIVQDHDEMKKMGEDVKKFLSQQNLAQAFRGRREPTSI